MVETSPDCSLGSTYDGETDRERMVLAILMLFICIWPFFNERSKVNPNAMKYIFLGKALTVGHPEYVFLLMCFLMYSSLLLSCHWAAGQQGTTGAGVNPMDIRNLSFIRR